MAIDKLTPRYLNKDSDERLIKNVEMKDALNVRISTENDGDGMVIKNAYGNVEISFETALPSGTNKVVGSTAFEQSGVIYFFVWNSNNNHCIYRYSTGSDTASLVYKDAVLGFTENGFVKGNVVLSSDGDELLYFNERTSAPKKINASKALRSTTYPGGATAEEKLLALTVAKQPPLKAPSYNIVNNPDVKDNRISDKIFQFAYRYVYSDGEYSALSPYSSAAVSIAQLRDGFNTQSAKDFYNQINVFVRNTTADVDKILVYARNGNTGVFYEIKEITNSGNNGVNTVRFTNDIVGSALSDTDINKLYDNVPQLADSQEIVEGRLMYGGYTEGYPNIDTDLELLDNYKDLENIYNIVLNPSSSTTVTRFTIDDSNLPNTFNSDSVLYVDFNFSGDTVKVGGNTSESSLDFDNFDIIFSDIDGSNVDSFTITKTEDYIPFLSNGINISERISIPAGTSKADAVKLFRDRLTSKKYELLLTPTNNQYVDLNNVGTNWVEETARFRGKANIKPIELSASEIKLSIQQLELYIVEFYKANKKKTFEAAPVIRIDYSSYNLNYQFENVFVSGTVFASAEKDSSTKTFKSGGSHKLGIVYYDDRNRSSGVQEVGDVYIKSLNDRTEENDLYGPSSIVMRLSHNPPSWAKKWAPVYTGRSSNELKLMYGIDDAFIPFRTITGSQNTYPKNSIYLSLNSLFAEDRGYNKTTGADLRYSFEKGDRLRVIVYDDDQRTKEEFNILGFTNLIDDLNNPILDESSDKSLSATTGDFLIIEENESSLGFNRASVMNRDTNWMKRCVIEIYRPNNIDEKIYYEIGKDYSIVSGDHEDERTATTFDLTVTESLAGGVFKGTTTVKVFKGDEILVGSNLIKITNSFTSDVNEFYAYSISGIPLSTGNYQNVVVQTTDKVIDLILGDAYFRKRLIYCSSKNRKNLSGNVIYPPSIGLVEYIEDYSASDFFNSKSSSIGRPIAYIPDAQTTHRKGSITYSDVYTIDGSRNGLSSFNLSLANYKDLAYEHGSIMSLISYNQRLYFIQEDRSGVVAVNRNIITTGSGDNLVSLSTNVLQSEQYYAANYGTQNPESVAHRDGSVFFTDVNSGKVVRITGNDIKPVSDINMESYFEPKFSTISKYQPKLIPAGIDTENGEYIISADEITEARVIINSGAYEYKAQLDSTGTQVIAQTSYNPSAVFSFSTEVRDFDNICDNFDDSLGAIVYLDELINGDPIYVNQPFQTSNLYGIATNKNYDFFVSINVNMFLPGFTFDNGYCDSDDTGAISSGAVVFEPFTAAYSLSNNVWTTRYSFIPEDIVSVHNTMYSFKSGSIYKHIETANRNTFYGLETAESIVEVISKVSPSAIKTYESISLEGNSAWDAVVSNTNQSAVIDDTSFKKKEGFYYAYIHGATTSRNGITNITSTSSTDEFFGLGVVDSVSNDTITFKNNIASMNFPLGTSSFLYKVNGTQLDALSLTASSISGSNQLTCNTNVTGLVQNDLVVLVADSAIEGDQIRDYFAKIKLTKTDTNPIELYAVNAVVTDSKAHN